MITIGIPLYNNSDTVGATISSLRNQTFENWNCVVADDSSSEASLKEAKNAIGEDSRFTVIRNQQRLGAAGNWNKTLSLATGKYFKLLCADDLLAPRALRLQLNALESNPSAVLCTGRRNIISSNGRVLLRNRGLITSTELLDSTQATNLFIKRGSNYFGEPSFAMFKTETLANSGGFNDSWSYLIDVESYLRCLNSGSLVALNENLGSFRISSKSWSASLVKEQRVETLRCIDYAASLPVSNVNWVYTLIGKSKATFLSYFRRLFFLFN